MRTLFIVLVCLLCSAGAQGEAKKTIGIQACKTFGFWDPDTIETGITGSEEAIIYISRELAKLDYQVIVLADPPPNSPHSLPGANPRFVPADYNDGTKFDIGIAWRLPCFAELLKDRAERIYLWPHDIGTSKYTIEQIMVFNDVLWLSEWQREQWVSVNPAFAKFTKIFGNGITPGQFQPVQQRSNPYSCIYGSNYARGLEILLLVWPFVKKAYPKATLDIYYGWQHYGLLTPEKEAKLRDLVAESVPLGVREHGLVGHEELNRAYERASFWTYPCTAPETFCITALRAQLAGAIPVVIDGTALSETVRHGYKCAFPHEYLALVLKAMKDAENVTISQRQQMGEFIRKDFTWQVIANKWKQVFESN